MPILNERRIPMKKEFVAPEIELVHTELVDVITTSLLDEDELPLVSGK